MNYHCHACGGTGQKRVRGLGFIDGALCQTCRGRGLVDRKMAECPACKGEGFGWPSPAACQTCAGTGWAEVLGDAPREP